jgi:hypothetical protein
MEARIKNICRSIQSKTQLEENLPQLFNYLADDYEVLAKVRLAMHYFTLYEAFYDDEDIWNKDVINEIHQMNYFIKDNILQSQSGEAREKAIYCIDTLRSKIMKQMNILTAYADIFQIYEYVLNRVEYRFKDVTGIVDDQEISKEILRFIFDSQDNLVINQKIKEIIGQLPIRITKQKYVEQLSLSLGAYLGAEGSSLDTFLYMIRTSAMLTFEEGMDTLYPTLWEKKEYLAHLDYKNISREEYEKAANTLHAATLTLETATEVYYELQEIVNEVYALLLCTAYAGLSGSIRENADKAADIIISTINEIFIRNDKQELSDEFMEIFADLEGVQEELTYDTDLLENALYEAEHNHKTLIEGLMLDKYLHVLKRTQGLLSSSLFIDFDEKTEATIVNEARIAKEAAKLGNELMNLFSGHDRMISRAVMANTIDKIPIFFKDHKEVMDYVLYSLERCTDSCEKIACIEIINDIMAE